MLGRCQENKQKRVVSLARINDYSHSHKKLKLLQNNRLSVGLHSTVCARCFRVKLTVACGCRVGLKPESVFSKCRYCHFIRLVFYGSQCTTPTLVFISFVRTSMSTSTSHIKCGMTRIWRA